MGRRCICGPSESITPPTHDVHYSCLNNCPSVSTSPLSLSSHLLPLLPLPQGNLRSWLLDENCYDQCAVIYNAGDTVAISQSTPHEIKVVTERKVRRAEGDALYFSGSCYQPYTGVTYCAPSGKSTLWYSWH